MNTTITLSTRCHTSMAFEHKNTDIFQSSIVLKLSSFHFNI